MPVRLIQPWYLENNPDFICKCDWICYTDCMQVSHEKEGNHTSDEVSTLIFPFNCTVTGRRLQAATGRSVSEMRVGTYTFIPERESFNSFMVLFEYKRMF